MVASLLLCDSCCFVVLARYSIVVNTAPQGRRLNSTRYVASLYVLEALAAVNLPGDTGLASAYAVYFFTL